MVVRSAARALVGRNYTASKWYAQRRMQHSGERTRRRIVVFTMGKTGSTAIARAVAEATGEYVFQVFRLRPDGVAGAEQRYRVRSRPPFPGAMHLWQSEFLVDHPPTGRMPWYVITSVREPVGQAISAFFHAQALESFNGTAVTDAVDDRIVAEQWFDRPAQWFEREFSLGLGIDALAEPFDPSVATARIDRPAVKVLLLRQENLDRASDALRGFLGCAAVDLARRNEGGSREDGARYRAFLDSARLPAGIVEATYSSAYSRHFYSDDELAKLRSHWIGHTTRRATNIDTTF
jgi:hypothetical protein